VGRVSDYVLIPYYEPAGSVVEAAAERVRGRVPAVRGLANRVEKDHKHVIDSVSGNLQSSMADAPQGVTLRATDVVRKAEFAAGCLEFFAQRIDDHNHLKSDRPRSVSRLNAEYNEALDDKFGVKVNEPGPNATPDQWDQAWDGFWKAFNAKKAALIHELRKEAAELDAWLDDRADDVSKMLKRGPNEEDIRRLWKAGALSPYAPLFFPGAGLSKIKLPAAAQRELLEDLIANPELLMAMPPALKAVVDRLPSDMRTKVYVEQRMAHLRDQGLLTGPNPGGRYEQWIRNTYLNGVPINTVIGIARDHDIRPDDFDVLNGLKEIKDPDGKSYFMLPTGIGPFDAKKAVLMTYILNAGTDYRHDPSQPHTLGDGNFAPTPYSSAEVQRIIDRQTANWATYAEIPGFHLGGGRMAATPNGMLMSAGGNWAQDQTAFGGGTTYGDRFIVNEDHLPNPGLDPEQQLGQIIGSGDAPNDPTLDLDRLLHHEEMHSQQWAKDPLFAEKYLWEEMHNPREENKYEKGAGLEDGGYPTP
jgi:hypothetical protein